VKYTLVVNRAGVVDAGLIGKVNIEELALQV
jgi:hypothetical protein